MVYFDKWFAPDLLDGFDFEGEQRSFVGEEQADPGIAGALHGQRPSLPDRLSSFKSNLLPVVRSVPLTS